MATTKSITERVEAPRLHDVERKNDIEIDSIEIAGQSHINLEVPTGKYRIIDISDSSLQKVTLNNVESFDSMIVRCEIEDSQATGLTLAQTNFKDVIFKNCRLNLTNFRNSTFTHCIFTGCDLNEADFGMSKLESVLFQNCELIKTDFSNCKCETVEFEDCNLSTINGVTGLKGAKLTQLNLVEIAPLLANASGILISD